MLSVSTVRAELSPAQEGLTDPTRPAEYQAAGPGGLGAGPPGADAAPQWVLKSTLISPVRRSAILNGRLVRQGEQFDQNVKVLSIRPGSVILKGPEGEFSVDLLSGPVKMSGKIRSSSP